MEIIRAEVLGFCFGVRRAVEYAQKALEENSERKVFSLGPLIHNENALNQLKNKGLTILEEDDLDSVSEGSVVIIRAHGVSPNIIRILEAKNCEIVNATCPRVNANQKMVERYSSEGKTIILTGDSNHGEVKGIAGFAKGKFIQIQSEEEAERIVPAESENETAILLSQTTFSTVQFQNISEIVGKKYPDLKIHNTICPATKERQDSLIKLCSLVDGVLVVGGKNSANTIRLYQSAEKNCALAAHIQGVEDIPEEFYSLKKIGITAGASTPDMIIDQVEAELRKKALC